MTISVCFTFFFSSRRRHTRLVSDWSSDVCSSDLITGNRIGIGLVNVAKTAAGNQRPKPGGNNDVVRQQRAILKANAEVERSEERRVGKECRARGARDR